MAGSNAAMFLALCIPVHRRGGAQGRHMATDETGQDPKLPPDARLGSLDERLERLQQALAELESLGLVSPAQRPVRTSPTSGPTFASRRRNRR